MGETRCSPFPQNSWKSRKCWLLAKLTHTNFPARGKVSEGRFAAKRREARAEQAATYGTGGTAARPARRFRPACPRCASAIKRASRPFQTVAANEQDARFTICRSVKLEGHFRFFGTSCGVLRGFFSRNGGRKKKAGPLPPGVTDLSCLDGGGKGSRTPDLLNAIQTLYQLSYTPKRQRPVRA